MVEKTTIEIRKEPTYKRLNARKGPGESFDDVVTQLLDDLETAKRFVDDVREGDVPIIVDDGDVVDRDDRELQEELDVDLPPRTVATDREPGRLTPADDQEGTPLTCHKCDYSWDYTGSMNRATCPDCKSTVKVENDV